MTSSYHTFWQRFIFIFFLITLCTTTINAQEMAEKYLIIHLDGTPVDTLFGELERGSLPNLASLFAGGQQVKHGVTVYPGLTPMVLSRLKKGLDNSGGIVGWTYIEQETDRKVGLVETFFAMQSQVSRLSRSQFAYQYPILNHIAGISLLNLDRLWETDDILEFYWLNSDTEGHSGGKAAQLQSLARLDHYLGLAAKHSELSDVNIILYADHGATLDDVVIIRYQDSVKEVLGEELKFLYYPNLFLHNPEKKVELAQKIIAETPLDLAAVKTTPNRVLGLTANGRFEIVEREGEFQYSYVDEDYLNYSELGYQGEFLTADEWLHFTNGHLYPATPVVLFKMLEHPDVGDIVISLDPPKIPYYVFGPQGHHASLQKGDLTVPLLFNGPAFTEVEPFTEFWLHEVFSRHLTMVDFASSARREKHSFTISYPFQGELVLSPAPRLRAGLHISEESVVPWLEYDLYSSFLTRFWVGAQYNDGPAYRLKAEAFLGDFKISWLKAQSEVGKLNFHWRVHKEAELILGRDKAGITILF